MSYVQIIEFRSANFAAMQEVEERWQKATEGKRTARRAVMCRDRNDANRYFNVVFFDSYDSAMQNSNLPETRKFSEEMMKHADGPATFYDLDVVEDRTLS